MWISDRQMHCMANLCSFHGSVIAAMTSANCGLHTCSGWNVGLAASSEQQALQSWRELQPLLVMEPAAELAQGGGSS